MNKLQFELSPYLNQHKSNPVNWYAWSDSVLKEAKRQNKPILVSIGYSTCHWCHVMAHESFEDEETARIMNDHFINVKVDREERPDLDHYFMNAIQAMGISGGWPLNCFLSSDGKPFFGGTYFPPEPKYGRPSWKQILMAVHQAYQNKQSQILDQAEQLYNHLNQINSVSSQSSQKWSEIDYHEVFLKLKTSMDLEHGGFGNHPKFPNTQGILLLFQLYFLTGNKEAIEHALFSLRQMCLGGIYDHIDGGFCRYSVDGNWDVPHFEKMLYDHAQLIQALSVAYTYTKSPFFKHIITQSLRFFEISMKDKCGLFYSAMDADSDGEEGSYYVWNEETIKQLLGNEFARWNEIFTYSNLDFNHTDKKVLRIKNVNLDDVHLTDQMNSLDTLTSMLRDERNKRSLPSIDGKMIVCWNAMIVSSYLSWYRASADESNFHNAEALMESILELCSKNKTELCRYRINDQSIGIGFLEDYAYVIKALLDLYHCSGKGKYIDAARDFFEYVQTDFKSPDSALFSISSARHTDFQFLQTDWAESTYPNPNAILSWACKYFYEYYQDERYLHLSASLMNSVREIALNHPLSMSSWIQQLLDVEMSSILVKSGSPLQRMEILKDLYIPGLMAIDQNAPGLTFCFDRICHQPVSTKEEIVSLFSKYHLVI